MNKPNILLNNLHLGLPTTVGFSRIHRLGLLATVGFSRILYLLAALAVIGCFETEKDSRLAGGDDYPNGVETLGKKAAQARADSADWNGFDSVPRSGPGLYDTVTVPDTVPDTSKAGQGAPAPKRAAYVRARPDTDNRLGGIPADTGLAGKLPSGGGLAGGDLLDTLVTKVIDTAKGTVAAIRTQITDSTRRTDSTVIVPSDPAQPGSQPGVGQVITTVVSEDLGRTDVIKFLDADGDGILTPRAGSANKAAIEVSTTLPGGVLQKRTQVIAAGADLDFNARGDNRLLASSLVTVLGGDTLELIRFLDADGDSVLLDFTKDSNLVDLIEIHKFPESSALVSVTRQVRIVASRDSTRNYPIRYTERKVFRDGAILDVQARGLGPDSSFHAGDEARWSETRFPPAGDSLERRSRSYLVKLGPLPGAFGANLLLGYTVEEKPRAAHGHFHFDFRSETPVKDGHWFATGDVVAWLTREDGARLAFSGLATAAGMQGQVTGPGGQSAAIRFDLAGTIVSPQP